MSTTDTLKKLFAAARPLVEQWFDITREFNVLFLQAWNSGELDRLWGLCRQEMPNYYLHYFIRARGVGDFKLGKSNHIRQRLVQIMHGGCSRGADLVACYPGDASHESELKAQFEDIRLNGEWFMGHSDLLGYLGMIGSDIAGLTNDPREYRIVRRPV